MDERNRIRLGVFRQLKKPAVVGGLEMLQSKAPFDLGYRTNRLIDKWLPPVRL